VSRARAAWDTAWLQPVLVVLVALLGGLFVSDFQKVTLALWVIYGLVALSLDLVWGRAGIFSFGQTAFFGVAAYSYGVIGINLSPNTGETVTALIGGVVVAALLAAALGYFMFYGKVGDVYRRCMRRACDNVPSMSRMIQIRNVPEPIHRTLKSRAAQAGMTLSDYLLSEVQEIAELPTIPELTQRIRQRTPTNLKTSSAGVIRRHRNAT